MFTCAYAPAPLAAQTKAAVPDSSRIIARLHVSPDVERTWERVRSCAGQTSKAAAARRLEDVVFLVRTPGAKGTTGKPLKGQFVPPDTILITQGYEHSGWIVAHELLHYLLGAEIIEQTGTDHPYVPFAFPCGLWTDPTSDVPELASAPTVPMVGGPHFAYPVAGFAVWIQGTLLAGHGWWRA